MKPNQAKTKEKLHVVDERGENLTAWEVAFIADLIDHPPRCFTKTQADVIQRIYRGRVKR